MNVMIIGSGGREHALAWKIGKSRLLGKLYIAPGNAGTALEGENVPINPSDFEAVRRTVAELGIDLLVVGPEAPLVEGLHDYLAAQPALKKLRIVGPVKAGAMLEGSKDFAKAFMNRHGIPTAAHRTFLANEFGRALEHLRGLHPPYVLKADGLAAGKGVLICSSLAEAEQELNKILVERRFGQAGEKVVIEEFLKGIECSVFVLTDGRSYCMLPPAKDYKRVGEGDTGPNTGGMGCISPVPFADEAFMQKVERRIIIPTIRGLRQEGIPYCGFIFAGLMNVGGEPYVIEYNVRLGDPEAEVVLPRIKSDLLELLIAAADGKLKEKHIRVYSKQAAAVMLVSGGYPGDYEKGKAISGLDAVEQSLLFHAGTGMTAGRLVTAGGRVIAVTSLARSRKKALELSYRNALKINFEKMYYRRDLGRDLARTKRGKK